MLQLRSTFKSSKSHACLLYITWVRDQFWFIVSCFHISLSSDLAVEGHIFGAKQRYFSAWFSFPLYEEQLYLFIPALTLQKAFALTICDRVVQKNVTMSVEA